MNFVMLLVYFVTLFFVGKALIDGWLYYTQRNLFLKHLEIMRENSKKVRLE